MTPPRSRLLIRQLLESIQRTVRLQLYRCPARRTRPKRAGRRSVWTGVGSAMLSMTQRFTSGLLKHKLISLHLLNFVVALLVWRCGSHLNGPAVLVSGARGCCVMLFVVSSIGYAAAVCSSVLKESKNRCPLKSSPPKAQFLFFFSLPRIDLRIVPTARWRVSLLMQKQ